MRNIIFDMGNVLIAYDPERFLDREGIADAGDRRRLNAAVFGSPDWARLDRGELDEPEFADLALARLPARLHAVARRLIFHWEQPMEPVPGMADFVRECKDRGMGVYLLSNASRRQREYWPDIPGSALFDGAVVSAFERCVKPMPGIYRILLERYGLNAEECVFVDDVPANVAAAKDAGMEGILFGGDVRALRTAVLGAHN